LVLALGFEELEDLQYALYEFLGKSVLLLVFGEIIGVLGDEG